MTHLAFSPYHNCKIRFRIKNYSNWITGAVIDNISFPRVKDFHTQYSFVPFWNLKAHKEAEKRKDFDFMRKLEQKIDILDIVEAKMVF